MKVLARGKKWDAKHPYTPMLYEGVRYLIDKKKKNEYNQSTQYFYGTSQAPTT